MFVLLSSLGYLLTKQKARSPAVKRVPHAFVQKQNLFCSFYAFVSGIRTGSAAFALRTPLSLLRVWIVLIIAYCQNFASTFCRHQGDFFRRLPYSIKLFLRFSSRIPVFAFFFSVKLSFGLNNFKITVFFPPRTTGSCRAADGPVRQPYSAVSPRLTLSLPCLSNSFSANFLCHPKSRIVSRFIVPCFYIERSSYFMPAFSVISQYYIFCEQSLHRL